MAIKGLTDRPAAFPVIGVLRKGEKKDTNGNAPGKDLSYLRFVTEDKLAEEMFRKAYPNEDALRNINVFLPHKTTDENMDSWIEKWVASSLVYRSDGETVVLWKTDKGAFSTEAKPDQKPEVGADGKRADGSSQVGRLSVIIPELGRFATVTVLTTSKHDIMNLTSQLRSYEALRGDLRGIPFVIKRRPYKISTPASGGKRARREKWLLSIETQPQWTMAQLTAMERQALPEVVDLEEGDFTTYELPASVFNPFDEAEVEAENGTTQSDPSPAPATTEAPKAPVVPNGKSEKLQRPLTAIQVRDGLRRRIEGDDNSPATKAQVGLVAGKLEEAFASDKDAKGKRLTVLHWFWNIESAKELTFKQAKVTLDWLLSGQTDGGGDHSLHPSAPEEAQRIYHEAMLAAGQAEMSLQETEGAAETTEGQADMFPGESLDDWAGRVSGGGAAYQD